MQEGEAPDAEFQWDQGTLKQLQVGLHMRIILLREHMGCVAYAKYYSSTAV